MSVRDKVQQGEKRNRKVRRKAVEDKGLSITSLLDVLTIILVFLIKNVSMESVKVYELQDMKYPSTMTVGKLMDKTEVTPVKMYLDKILLGTESLYFGTPTDLKSSEEKRALIERFLTKEFNTINDDPNMEPCLVIQADINLPCDYITEMVRLGTAIGYPNIYFATVEEQDWLKAYNPVASR